MAPNLPLHREQPVQFGFNGDTIGGCSRPVSFALASETRVDINTPYHELDGAQRIR